MPYRICFTLRQLFPNENTGGNVLRRYYLTTFMYSTTVKLWGEWGPSAIFKRLREFFITCEKAGFLVFPKILMCLSRSGMPFAWFQSHPKEFWRIGSFGDSPIMGRQSMFWNSVLLQTRDEEGARANSANDAPSDGGRPVFDAYTATVPYRCLWAWCTAHHSQCRQFVTDRSYEDQT